MPRILDGHLSRGQLAALLLAANGLTSRQIASELGTTESGIHQRVNEATHALGARSRTHAIAICIARGLIAIDDIAIPGRQRAA
ncbi:LuxR C-terminal-related transcriptional regulator [Streptomyces sp. NBC_01456]|uniref:LuxR C-terminal-related transcriptional regulator n=1 Tax=unclassified Streptomyces TaxID=2593676 RepID=UPI002E37B7A1|nr:MULTISPECIES: LuxR C-terminal-related transcriptional regulator [unclassified Streptomyces]